jgi:type II secretory pathway component GspD/PulD (secretin)
MAIQPAIIANKTANTITVRATASVVQIIEKIIQQNDKPRAEIVVDVEILEGRSESHESLRASTSRSTRSGRSSRRRCRRTTRTTTTTGGTGTTAGGATVGGTQTTAGTGSSTTPSGVRSPAPFNLNTISRGRQHLDFYLAVPTAIVNFLESDTHTRIIAKPQIRGRGRAPSSHSSSATRCR